MTFGGVAVGVQTGACMVESRPKELYVQMPVLEMMPIEVKNIVPAHVYACPVYKTSTRFGMLSTTGHSTNFVMFFDLPMQETDDEKWWVKRGVAMLSMKND